MRILVSGASGLLGKELMREISQRGHEAVGIGRRDADITDRAAVLSLVEAAKPDSILHCAAWTNVDAAEAPENRPLVRAVNVGGTKNMAEAAARAGAKLLYLSTDYVFGGEGSAPRKPDDKRFAPLNFYGQTKLEGERAVAEALDRFFIVRTSWLFGSGGKNFIRTMIDAGRKRDAVRVVNDQIGTPTYARDLAGLLTDMVLTDRYGFYHATNAEAEKGGYISWYDLTKEVYRQIGCETEVIPVSTADYGCSAAVRPLNSRLDKSKLTEAGFQSLPDWKDAVRRYVAEIHERES